MEVKEDGKQRELEWKEMEEGDIEGEGDGKGGRWRGRKMEGKMEGGETC